MNWLDAFILAAAAVWAFIRSRRGALRVAIEFFSAALGLWAAVRFTDAAAAALRARGVPYFVGWPGAFGALLLIPAVIGQTMSGTLAARQAELGPGRIDRAAGVVIGLGEVFVVAGMAIVAVAEWGGRLSEPPWIDSIIVGWLVRVMPVLYDWAAEVLTL